VDRFYVRLLTDPVAMRLLPDDGTVLRLKRSLNAWFDELFAQDFDRVHETTRSRIGEVHVRIGMPQYLMVTAMSGIRESIAQSVSRLWREEPEQGAAITRALSLALDLELALMIEGYRRHARRLSRHRDRAVFTERAARRLIERTRDRVDAALCHLELASRAVGPEGEADVAQVRELLAGLVPGDRGLPAPESLHGEPPRPVRVSDLVVRALEDVGFAPQTRVHPSVQPADLVVPLRGEAVLLALEELLQNAANHAGARNLYVSARLAEGDALRMVLEVRDDGVGWPRSALALEDARRPLGGLGLAFCELVAEIHHGTVELFRAAEGGAGVRLNLDVAFAREALSHADQPARS
jgi:signal transduction histidine kinase